MQIKHISIRISEDSAKLIKRASEVIPRQSVNTFVAEAAVLAAKEKLSKK